MREKLLPWLPAGSFCPCVWRALAVPSLTKRLGGSGEGEGGEVRVRQTVLGLEGGAGVWEEDEEDEEEAGGLWKGAVVWVEAGGGKGCVRAGL